MMQVPFWIRCIIAMAVLLVPHSCACQKPMQSPHVRKVTASDFVPQHTNTISQPVRTKIEELDHQIQMKANNRFISSFCSTDPADHQSKNCKRLRKDSRKQDLRVAAMCFTMKRSQVPEEKQYAMEVCKSEQPK
jgi:hypothetical protein